MWSLWGDLKDQFKLTSEVDEDNKLFKLVSKISVGVCILATIILAADSYAGDAIHCDLAGENVEGDVVEDYCWIHGTSHIDKTFKANMDKWFNLHKINGMKEASPICQAQNWKEYDGMRDTKYYQWVPFMFMVSAIIFLIPNQIWKGIEGGFVAGFVLKETQTEHVMKNINKSSKVEPELIDDGKGGKKVNPATQSNPNDPVSAPAPHIENNALTSLAKKQALYFQECMGDHGKKIYQFLGCEILTVLTVVLNFYFVNWFLNYQFWNYGPASLQYFMKTREEKLEEVSEGVLKHIDPMCNVFPTLVQCNYYAKLGGTAGYQFGCILSQNIINEKIYFFLWWWILFVFIIAVVNVVRRVYVIAIPTVRHGKINRKAGTDDYTKINGLDIGDWFMLNQIGKNVDGYYFKLFVRELVKLLGEKRVPQHQNSWSIANFLPKRRNNNNQGNVLPLTVQNSNRYSGDSVTSVSTREEKTPL